MSMKIYSCTPTSCNTLHIAHRTKTWKIFHRHHHRSCIVHSENKEQNPIPDNINDPIVQSQNPGQQPSAGSYAIPTTSIPPAGAIFILAGFLKILIVCFPFSTMAISMYLQGRADLGFWAALKMFPMAIGFLALAKTIVDKKLNKRPWASGAIVLFSIAALFLSRWLFARPRASPLDPLLESHKRQTIAAAIERQRVARAVEEHERRRADQEGGSMMATSEAARKYLEEKSKNDRFAGQRRK